MNFEEIVANFINNFWILKTVNLTKAIIESSHEHLNIYKISSLYNKSLQSYGPFHFAAFSEFSSPHLHKHN